MKDKLYEMMHRHAAAAFASDELTLLKAQIGDLVDATEAKEPLEIVIMHLNDISGSIAILETRLDLVREIAEYDKD